MLILQFYTIPNKIVMKKIKQYFIQFHKTLLNDSKLGWEFFKYSINNVNFIHNKITQSNKISLWILFQNQGWLFPPYNLNEKIFLYLLKSLRNKFNNNVLFTIIHNTLNNNNIYYNNLTNTSNNVTMSILTIIILTTTIITSKTTIPL